MPLTNASYGGSPASSSAVMTGAIISTDSGLTYLASADDRVIDTTADGETIGGNNAGDTIFVLNSGCVINGGSGNDLIVAAPGSGSYFLSHGGDDVLYLEPGAGGVFDGGAGYDTVVTTGLLSQYPVSAVTPYRGGSVIQSGGAPYNVTYAAPMFSIAAGGGARLYAAAEALRFLDGTLQTGNESVAAQVTRLYLTALGRAPDPLGLVDAVRRIESGASLKSMAAAFLGSAEGRARQGALDATSFVTQLYQAGLGRAPDAAGLSSYVSQLTSGSATRADIVIDFSESVEAEAYTGTSSVQTTTWVPDEQAASVARVYDSALGRLPDAGGMATWVNALEGTPLAAPTMSLHDIANQFMASAEFRAIYGAPTDQSFVQLLYANTLHRAPDAAGAAFWQASLASGTDRASVLLGFSESPEHQAMLVSRIEVGGIQTKG